MLKIGFRETEYPEKINVKYISLARAGRLLGYTQPAFKNKQQNIQARHIYNL